MAVTNMLRGTVCAYTYALQPMQCPVQFRLIIIDRTGVSFN